jgi:hypothetical protein
MRSVWIGSKLILYRPIGCTVVKGYGERFENDGTSEDASKFIKKN